MSDAVSTETVAALGRAMADRPSVRLALTVAIPASNVLIGT